MACCTESAMNEDMPCCDMDATDMDNCSMDSCSCSLATSISASTTHFNKELNLISIYEEHAFPLVSSNVQTPLFPIWTPPDIV